MVYMSQVSKGGRVPSVEDPSALEQKAVAHFTLLKRVDSFMMAVRE